jgi:Tfp pilus assembly protein PilE
LIEVLIVIAIVSILAAIAMPSYTAYLQRSKVPAGLDALQSYFTRMEQRFQDAGTYANASACALAVPTAQNYTISCTVSAAAAPATPPPPPAAARWRATPTPSIPPARASRRPTRRGCRPPTAGASGERHATPDRPALAAATAPAA